MLRHALLFFGLLAPAHGLPVVLYNGSLNTGLTSQGWSFGADALSFSQNVSGGATTLTTTGSIRAGYSILSPFTLDHNVSYNFTFDVQLNSEDHSVSGLTNDRSGFSIIVISSDLQGIELGFWTTDIWAQNVGFTHGEDKAIDTTQRRTYSLGIGGSGYQLSSGGAVLLSGALRTYSGFPYNVPNFIFVGDDTHEANANSSVFGVTAATPEPGAIVLTLAGLALVIGRASRRSATR